MPKTVPLSHSESLAALPLESSFWRAWLPPPGLGWLGWCFALHLLTVWGLAASNTFLGLMILGAIFQWRRLDWRWPERAALWVPLGIYTILYVASVVFSLEPATSRHELKDLLSFATLVLAPIALRTEAQIRWLCRWLLLVLTLLALHGISQYLFGSYGTLHHRIVGMFSHYQTLAGVLLLGLLLACATLAAGRRSWGLWVSAAVLLAAILLGLTRGAWVAAAATLLFLALIRVRRFLVVYLGTATFLTLFMLFLAPTTWLDRAASILDLKDVSNYDRLCMAEAGLLMVRERPFLGVGPEVVESRYPLYRHPTAPRVEVPHLHNAWLQRAAEQGIPAFVVYLWLMVGGLRLALAGFRDEGGLRGSRADLWLAILVIVVGFNIASLFEDNWRDTEVRRLFLFFLALPLCLGQPPEKENE